MVTISTNSQAFKKGRSTRLQSRDIKNKTSSQPFIQCDPRPPWPVRPGYPFELIIFFVPNSLLLDSSPDSPFPTPPPPPGDRLQQHIHNALYVTIGRLMTTPYTHPLFPHIPLHTCSVPEATATAPLRQLLEGNPFCSRPNPPQAYPRIQTNRTRHKTHTYREVHVLHITSDNHRT